MEGGKVRVGYVNGRLVTSFLFSVFSSFCLNRKIVSFLFLLSGVDRWDVILRVLM